MTVRTAIVCSTTELEVHSVYYSAGAFANLNTRVLWMFFRVIHLVPTGFEPVALFLSEALFLTELRNRSVYNSISYFFGGN